MRAAATSRRLLASAGSGRIARQAHAAAQQRECAKPDLMRLFHAPLPSPNAAVAGSPIRSTAPERSCGEATVPRDERRMLAFDAPSPKARRADAFSEDPVLGA